LIDIDGNGTVDVRSAPDVSDPQAQIAALKATITALLGGTPRARQIHKRLDRLSELIKKGKFARVERISNRLEKRIEKIGHRKLRNLSSAEKERIAKMVEVFIAQLETL
jgi:hypothetical protein